MNETTKKKPKKMTYEFTVNENYSFVNDQSSSLKVNFVLTKYTFILPIIKNISTH